MDNSVSTYKFVLRIRSLFTSAISERCSVLRPYRPCNFLFYLIAHVLIVLAPIWCHLSYITCSRHAVLVRSHAWYLAYDKFPYKTLVLKHPQFPSSLPYVNIIIRLFDDGYKHATSDTPFVQEALRRSFCLFCISQFFSALTTMKLFHIHTPCVYTILAVGMNIQ